MKGWKRGGLFAAIVACVAIGGYFAWKALQPAGLPEGIASGNGRIEAVEIDISTRVSGRIKEILANEGDFVTVGQVIAQMDTDQLQAQRSEAVAGDRKSVV